jgi:hypothetical protein
VVFRFRIKLYILLEIHDFIHCIVILIALTMNMKNNMLEPIIFLIK